MDGRAFAKINLILEITGKRDDGYHEIDTVMAEVGLFDEMSLEKADTGISLKCDDPAIPSGEENLAYKAAEYMLRKHGIKGGVSIGIKKHIPYGKGLGGGSSDAAWVIKAMNREFALALSDEELEEDAAHIGSDTAFFIKGGIQRARGRGEKLSVIDAKTPSGIVIVCPDFSVSTSLAYGELRPEETGGSERVDEFVKALENGDLKKMCALAENTLEYPSVRLFPEIGEIRKKLLSGGALAALMTGSGSAVFGIFESEAAAHALAEEVSEIRGAFMIFLRNTLPLLKKYRKTT